MTVRTTLRALPALVLVLVLVLAAGCGAVPPDGAVGQGPAQAGRWTRLADSPLSPREGVVVASLGDEVVVVGGYGGPPCPPGADCAVPEDAVERDGAALDLGTNAWREITEAPLPVPPGTPSAVIGTRLYVLVDDSLLVWDSKKDLWEQVDTPRGVRWSAIVVDGTRLILASGSDENGVRPDHVLDTATGEWSTLPEDPLKPAFDRTLTPTPEGLVLTAQAIDDAGNPVDPSLVRAALLPRGSADWDRLPVSDQLGGWRWTWTGRHLVDPTLGGADGGQTNGYGRVIPYGGRLDPATRTWSRLPDAPAEGSGGWPVEALHGPLAAAEGWLFDDASETWTRLTRPQDAPEEPGPAVWADGQLVVHGGAQWGSEDTVGDASPDDVWSTGVWAYQLD